MVLSEKISLFERDTNTYNDITMIQNIWTLLTMITCLSDADETIVDSVKNNKRKMLFLGAPVSTRKKFLAKLIFTKIRQPKKISLAEDGNNTRHLEF